MADGCITTHSVMIHDRGGVRRIAQLVDVTEVEYVREVDIVTGARIVVAGQACADQMPTLLGIRSRRHEVVIFRGNDRPWEGPIVDIKRYADRVEIFASDVGEYVRNTPLTRDWPNEDGGGPRYMTQRVEQILEHELTESYVMETNAGEVEVPRWENLDPPANVLPHLDVRQSTGSQGILTRSTTLAFEMTVGEHLANLAEGGLEYATVGRSLVVWDRAHSIGRTRPVTEADFYGDIVVIEAGSEHASIGHISAQRDDVEGAPDEDPDPDEGAMNGVGNAGEPDDYYGVWTRLTSLASEEGSDTPNQLELNSQARRTIAGRSPVPVEIVVPQGAGLRLSDDLTLRHLVPGVIIPVRAVLNHVRVSQDQRLDRVVVRETAAGETVQVNLSPAGIVEMLP